MTFSIILSSLLIGQTTINQGSSLSATVPVEELMNSISRSAGVSLIVDMEGEHQFEKEILRYDPYDAIAVVAGRLKRTLVKLPGCWVLKRWPANSDQVMMTPAPRMIAWAKTLSEKQVRQAAKFDLELDSLSREQRAAFLQDMPISGQMAGLVVGSRRSNWIGLAYTATFRFTDPRSGMTVSHHISPLLTHKRTIRIPSEAQIPREVQEKEEPPYEQVGQLLAFEGSTLKVSSIVNLAQSMFKVRYLYDQRLNDSNVFVAGKFDKVQFELALNEIVATEPPAIARFRNDLVSLELSAALKGPLSVLEDEQGFTFSIAELLQGLSLSAAEVSERSPAMAAVFERYGVLFNANIELGVALIVFFEAGNQRIAYKIGRQP